MAMHRYTWREQRPALIVGFLAAVLEGYDLQSAGLAGPGMAAEFALSRWQLGEIFSSSTLGLFVGALAGGRLSDSVGRKTGLVCALVTFGCFSMASALAGDFTMLAMMRFLTGVGLGGALPNLIALVAAVSAPHIRAGRVAMIAAGMPLGGSLAAFLSRWLSMADWRVIFVVGGVAPCLLAIAALRWLYEGPREGGGASARKDTSFVQALFAGRRSVATLALWASSFCTLLVLYLMLNWLPTLMLERVGDRNAAPWAVFGFSLAGAFGGLVFGYTLRLRARTTALLIAHAGLGGSLLALSFAPEPAVVVAASLTGFFVTGIQFVLYGLAADCYPAALRGTGTGAAVAMGRLGAIAGPLLAGGALSAGADLGSLLTCLLPVLAVSAAATVVLTWQLRGRSSRRSMPPHPFA